MERTWDASTAASVGAAEAAYLARVAYNTIDIRDGQKGICHVHAQGEKINAAAAARCTVRKAQTSLPCR